MGLNTQSINWQSPFVQFGVGAFETLRCEEGHFPLAKWHLRRITRALDAWGLPQDHLKAPWENLLRRGQELNNFPFRRMKLLIGLDENDELVHHIFDFEFEPNPASRILKTEDQQIFLPQPFKTSSYEEHYWARRRASAEGVQDVLYLDDNHQMLEASTSCLLLWDGSRFLVRDGGPVLASSSLESLMERFPESFCKVQDFGLKLTHQYPLLMMSALNGMAHIGALLESGTQRQLLPLTNTFLEEWNNRLFQTGER